MCNTECRKNATNPTFDVPKFGCLERPGHCDRQLFYGHQARPGSLSESRAKIPSAISLFHSWIPAESVTRSNSQQITTWFELFELFAPCSQHESSLGERFIAQHMAGWLEPCDQMAGMIILAQLDSSTRRLVDLWSSISPGSLHPTTASPLDLTIVPKVSSMQSRNSKTRSKRPPRWTRLCDTDGRSGRRECLVFKLAIRTLDVCFWCCMKCVGQQWTKEHLSPNRNPFRIPTNSSKAFCQLILRLISAQGWERFVQIAQARKIMKASWKLSMSSIPTLTTGLCPYLFSTT